MPRSLPSRSLVLVLLLGVVGCGGVARPASLPEVALPGSREADAVHVAFLPTPASGAWTLRQQRPGTIYVPTMKIGRVLGLPVPYPTVEGRPGYLSPSPSDPVLCALPCAAWASTSNHLYAQREGFAAALLPPLDFPAGSEVDVVAKPRRGWSDEALTPWRIAGIGGSTLAFWAGLIGSGFAIWGSSHSSRVTGARTAVGGFSASAVLLAIPLSLDGYREPDRVETSPARGAR
jgi:hypothetical protein